jgi:glucan phosphoethanolaminetransferase (alkaline phosphatase superfamily)
MAQLHSVASAMAYGFVLWVLLLASDVLLIREKLIRAKRKKFLHYASVLLLLSLLIGSAQPPALAIALIIFAFVLSLCWHLSYAYIGDALRPESLLIFVKPDHFADAVEAGVNDIRRLAPALLLVCGCGLLALLLLWTYSPPTRTYGWISSLAAVALIVMIGLRAAFRKNESSVYPVLAMPSAIGTIHAVALAVAWYLRNRGSGEVPLKTISLNYRRHPAEPCTVAVLMGEGIAPARMSMFGCPKLTTPLLSQLYEHAGDFRLLPKSGFSFGVSSNSSISAFLSGSPHPLKVSGARSLFQLAREQGFTTHYLSNQKRSPLDATAGASDIDFVHTRETLIAKIRERKDWAIVDLVRDRIPAEKEFFFIFPRVNHSPYFSHQVGTNEPYHSRPRNLAEIIENYDVGVRAFDRFASGLLDAFVARSDRPIFIFVTSDHNELLGDEGLVGHNISGSLLNAAVPIMLFTNRPDHPVTKAFEECERPDAFQVAGLVAQCLGVEIEADAATDHVFNVNNTLPFGRAGYFMARRTRDPSLFEVTQFDRSGREGARQTVSVANFAPVPRTGVKSDRVDAKASAVAEAVLGTG